MKICACVRFQPNHDENLNQICYVEITSKSMMTDDAIHDISISASDTFLEGLREIPER